MDIYIGRSWTNIHLSDVYFSNERFLAKLPWNTTISSGGFPNILLERWTSPLYIVKRIFILRHVPYIFIVYHWNILIYWCTARCVYSEPRITDIWEQCNIPSDIWSERHLWWRVCTYEPYLIWLHYHHHYTISTR